MIKTSGLSWHGFLEDTLNECKDFGIQADGYILNGIVRIIFLSEEDLNLYKLVGRAFETEIVIFQVA